MNFQSISTYEYKSENFSGGSGLIKWITSLKNINVNFKSSTIGTGTACGLNKFMRFLNISYITRISFPKYRFLGCCVKSSIVESILCFKSPGIRTPFPVPVNTLNRTS